MARPVLAVGGIALIAVGAAIGFGGWWPSTSTAEEYRRPIQRIDTVSIDIGSGDVRIRVGNVGTATIHQRFTYRGSHPGQDAFVIDGTRLRLQGCGDDCTVDYDVVVPVGTTVTGQAGSGDISTTGLAATDVSTRSGDVHVTDAGGPITAHAGSGDVTVDLATPQDVRADTGSGDVKVTVPPDRYRIQVDTGSGDRNIEIASDAAGAHLLDLRAGSGDVSLSPA